MDREILSKNFFCKEVNLLAKEQDKIISAQ